MQLIPSVLNWSYHREYGRDWSSSLASYMSRVAEVARRNGFDRSGINIGVGGPQNQLASFDREYVQQVRRQLEELGLYPITILGNLEIHADQAMVERSIADIEPALERSSWLGAGVTTFGTSLHGRLTREKAVTVYADSARRLAGIAARYGLSICSENYNTFTSDELVAVVERSNADNHGYLNDIGNWLITGEDPLSVSRKLLPRTIHAHVKDYLLDDGVWRSVPLGEGIVPVTKILDLFSSFDDPRTVYLALETDLDEGSEDKALDLSYAYFGRWAKR